MGSRRIARTVEGEERWQCTRCKAWLPRETFYLEQRSRAGIKSECKPCHVRTSIESRDPARHRRTNAEWMRSSDYGKRPEVRERERSRSRRRSRSIEAMCRAILNDAVSSGIAIRPTQCARCDGATVGWRCGK